MGFKFNSAEHEALYNLACSKVRKLRNQIIENLDNDLNVISAELDDQLSKDLTVAKAEKLKLQPKHQQSRDILLHAYA